MARITADMVELVEYSKLEIGDTTVHFTPACRSITIGPTDRQLALKRTRYTKVDTITPAVLASGVNVLDVNGGPVVNPEHGATALPYAKVWRVKR